MKSIERRFNNITATHPLWSSYICFAEAIASQRFTSPAIHKWFQRLVNKSDYCKAEKRRVLVGLDKLTNYLRTTKITGRMPVRRKILRKE